MLLGFLFLKLVDRALFVVGYSGCELADLGLVLQILRIGREVSHALVLD